MPSRSGSDHQHEILEVEDVEQRRRRLRKYPAFLNASLHLSLSAEDILERLNGEGSSTEQQSPNLSFDFGARRTFAIEPPAECAPPPYNYYSSTSTRRLQPLQLTQHHGKNSACESPRLPSPDREIQCGIIAKGSSEYRYRAH
jgi:hypothetical protein